MEEKILWPEEDMDSLKKGEELDENADVTVIKLLRDEVKDLNVNLTNTLMLLDALHEKICYVKGEENE